MSSVVGHAAAGIAAYLACNRKPGERRALRALPAFAFLAICPDLDYLAIWLFDAVAETRFTHSFLVALATAFGVRSCMACLRRGRSAQAPFVGLLAASFSHPMLDLLVGAHPVPLLWPLPDHDIALPFGVLPSAGRLALGNYYLWRNLLIELAVLLPVLTVLVASARRTPSRLIAKWLLPIAPVWLVFVAWSASLPR